MSELSNRVGAVVSAQAAVHLALARREDSPANRAQWSAAAFQFHTAVDSLYGPVATMLAGLKAGDASAIEPAIEFLELDPWCFRSGYAKADLAKALGRAQLTVRQTDRLRRVIVDVLRKGPRRELRAYCRLAKAIDSPELRRRLEVLTRGADPATARAATWALAAGAENDAATAR